jgi:hypothetical protein
LSEVDQPAHFEQINRKLRKQQKETEQERPKESAGLLRETQRIFEFISREKANFSINLMCRIMEVSRSGCYAWAKRKSSSQKTRRNILKQDIRNLFVQHCGRYGVRRIFRLVIQKGPLLPTNRSASHAIEGSLLHSLEVTASPHVLAMPFGLQKT